MNADELITGYLESGTLDEAALASLSEDDRARLVTALPELDRVRAALADDDLWHEPGDGLPSAVVAAILAEPAPASAPTAAPTPAPTAAAPAAPGPVADLAEARVRRARIAAIAASMVAAAAVVVAIIGFASRPPAPVDQTASGDPTRSIVGSSVASSTSTTPDDVLEVGFAGSNLAPGVRGTVRLKETESGVWIRLDASGLPRRDHGDFYEAWARTDDGLLVPIGTFHTGDDVVLWSGVAISDTAAITVTLERNDGNQESSGERVLVATLPDAPDPSPPGPPGSTPGSLPS